jgi:3-aminobutyryl-CoA ammonia-lyase
MSVGLTVTHRRYIKYGDAHYGGGLVDGAYVLGMFGDVATEACIRMAGDEGLFASYSDVQFRAPVLAGDVIEAECVVTSVGRRSRQLSFEARVVCRADPSRGPSASIVLDEPVVAVTATGTVVVPLTLSLDSRSGRPHAVGVHAGQNRWPATSAWAVCVPVMRGDLSSALG